MATTSAFSGGKGYDGCGRRASGLSHGLEGVGDPVVVGGQEVAVAVEHRHDRRVACPGLHLVWVGSGGDPERHRCVAEVVDAEGLEVRRSDGARIRGTTDAQGRTGLQKSELLEAVSLRILPTNLSDANLGSRG